MTNHLLCCDWGTSSFRLQLIRLLDYGCVGEISSSEGVAVTFDGWRRTGRPAGVAKDAFFRQQLKPQIDALARNVAADLTDVPVVISGMASSSIGMDEVPYATLPFALDGRGASVRHLEAPPDFPHPILLIAGVRSQQDVMRGEETQLIGVWTLLNQAGERADQANPGWANPAVPRRDRASPGRASPGRAIFIFPGTHSKHMTIEAGYLTHFDTYMTGELFDLMARQSILHDSVDADQLAERLAADRGAFRRGVRQGATRPVLNSLFTVRTNGLFGKLTKPQNALYLSGLLIGAELVHLRAKPDWPIVLCSGRNLSGFYQLALDELGFSARTEVIPSDLVDRAASAGQLQLYRHQDVNQPTE